METLESDYRMLDLLYGFALRYDPESVQKCIQVKTEVSRKIMELLSRQKFSQRRCKYCGRPLAWKYAFSMCAECYADRYYSDYDDRWFRSAASGK